MSDEYPLHDTEFEEHVLTSVKEYDGGGFEIAYGSTVFFCPSDTPIRPESGTTARFYGKGMGFPVRGLFIDGRKVFYRTESEQEQKSKEDSYGADIKEWLARWDAGRNVWSVEMGGLGPGYEQAIQITVAEIVRHMVNAEYDASTWPSGSGKQSTWRTDREKIEEAMFANPTVSGLGLSGAQFGAAISLASSLYMQGPIAIMTNPELKGRHIQVSKDFPRG